ncbi:MAG: two pore domain potassium channel family protein [Actinobacteria bacterium]|nr:two pore domain potassium channel family protein [Actinomycetota bacterium]
MTDDLRTDSHQADDSELGLRESLSLFMPQKDPQLSKPVMAAISTILIFLGMGMVVYHALEKWSWIECLYFSTYSLTTVGYGDFTPTNDASRLFTVFYLLTGVGAVVASLGVIGARYLEIRDRKIKERLLSRNADHPDDAGQPPKKAPG